MSKTPRPVIRRTVVGMDRATNSHDGNPRFVFRFADGLVAKTEPDAQFCYAITSSWEGKTFDVTLNGRGTIAGMIPAVS